MCAQVSAEGLLGLLGGERLRLLDQVLAGPEFDRVEDDIVAPQADWVGRNDVEANEGQFIDVLRFAEAGVPVRQ